MPDYPTPAWDEPTPPTPPTAPRSPARPRRIGVWIAVALAAVLLIGGVAAAVTLSGSSTAEAAEVVELEPAATAGTDAFMTPPSSTGLAAFIDAVQQVADTSRAAMAADTTTGALTVAGTTGNLYGGQQTAGTAEFGGSGRLAECDIAALADYLAANPAKATAWAGVLQTDPSTIADYLQELTPVVLLHDTRVTNYGFSNGVAVPRQSVLQAGTGVLIDDTGRPVVRCACGNPLSAPLPVNLSAADLQGTRWDGYDPGRTVAVSSGPSAAEFLLVDINTGASYPRSAGSAAPVIDLLAAVDGDVQQSADGQSWTTVAHSDAGSLDQLAVSSDGRAVAVGGIPNDDGRPGTGLIVASQDGLRWGEPVVVQDYLVDIAFGNGMWLAIGPGEDSLRENTGDTVDFPVYRSTDGASWGRADVSVAVESGFAMNATSIVYGNGTWLIDVIGGLGDSAVQAVLTSTDGTNWTSASTGETSQSADAAYSYGRAWNGQVWGITGTAIYFDNGLEGPTRNELRVGASTDGLNWQPVPASPVAVYLPSLSCTGDRGWLAVGQVDGLSSPDVPGAIYTSPDLASWTIVTGPAGSVTDVVGVGSGAAAAATACGTPPLTAPIAPATTAPAAPVPPGDCVLNERTPDGSTALVGVPASLDAAGCDDIKRVWTRYASWTGERMGTAAAVVFDDGWECSITPLSATLPGQNAGWDGRLGDCYLGDWQDGKGFAVYPQGTQPASAAAPSTAAEPGQTSGPVPGDLGLSRAMTRPACDGTGIVLLFSSVTPGGYAAEIGQYLDRYPDASYLRTDQSCSSLNQATESGGPIYAVYRPIGPDQTAVCAAVAAAGPPAYGKWLDSTSDPDVAIDCG